MLLFVVCAVLEVTEENIDSLTNFFSWTLMWIGRIVPGKGGLFSIIYALQNNAWTRCIFLRMTAGWEQHLLLSKMAGATISSIIWMTANVTILKDVPVTFTIVLVVFLFVSLEASEIFRPSMYR